MKALSDLRADFSKKAPDLGGVGVAHGVGQADPIGARIDTSLRETNDRTLAHLSLDRAAEGRSKSRVNADRLSATVSEPADLRKLAHHLDRRPPHIGRA